MEVEIEKVVKAWNEVQSAAEVADREEQIAHNKESRTTSSRRRMRENASRKWKLNSGRYVMTSSLPWTRTSSHRPEGLQKPKAISKRALKTSSSLSESIMTRSQISDRFAM